MRIDTHERIPLPHLAFQVLVALGANPNHGYGIAKEVEANTHGRTRPGTGSLYLSMAKLRKQGLIEPVSAPADADARRRYFQLTATGRQVAMAESRRLARLLEVARSRRLLAPEAEV